MKNLKFTEREVKALLTCIRLMEKATVREYYDGPVMEIELQGEKYEAGGICRILRYIFNVERIADYQASELIMKLYEFYTFQANEAGKTTVLLWEYWFPEGVLRPRIKFLKEALDQHFENEKARTISKMGYSLLLCGVCLIGSGLSWEVSDRVSSSMLGAGAGISSVGLFLVIIVKWVRNENK